MTKRSFLLTVAAGLLASVAFATPSQAGSITVTTAVTFSLPSGDTGTFTDIDVTYKPSVDPISNLALVSSTVGAVGLSESSSNTVTATFAATTGGTVTWSYVTATSPPIGFSSFGFSGSATGATDTVSITSVPNVIPEPTSIALLGIGMTGFLAIRRFFKRTPIA